MRKAFAPSEMGAIRRALTPAAQNQKKRRNRGPGEYKQVLMIERSASE
jgi:hypothetical protein